MLDDAELLHCYAHRGPGHEEAFAELVRRHLNLVYSTALRLVHPDAHRAQDVSQQVFANLARRAQELPAGTVLPGWLHRDTCFTALEGLRAERRRATREIRAMKDFDPSPDPTWEGLRPVIDAALEELSELDRHAVLLRYFEGRTLQEVGARLGLGESGASRRLTRALERLRGALARRGVTTTAAALAIGLTTQAVHAAPVGLAASITAASLSTTTAAVTTAASVGSNATLSGATAGSVASGAATTSSIGISTWILLMKMKIPLLAGLLALILGSAGYHAIQALHRNMGQMGERRTEALAEQRRHIQPTLPLLVQLIRHAADHGGQLPVNLGAVGGEDAPFELIGKGPLVSQPGVPPVPILREKVVWTAADGRRSRTYGYSDGHAEVRRQGDPGFEE